jgi:DNA-binding PadR family transcriptional regulator
MFRYLVLGLLRLGGPLHGYALMKAYRERSGTRISTGSFYRELTKLVAGGLVEMAARAPDEDPRRAPYRLTAAGVAAFETWLAGPHTASMGSQDDELSLAVLFLAEADPGVVERLFGTLQEDLWMRSKALERAREGGRAAAGDPGRFDTLDLLLGRRQKHVAAELEFLAELRAAYERAVSPGQAARKAAVRPPERLAPRRAGRDGR